MATEELGYSCRYNESIQCQEMNCSACGWNPAISERRLRKILKRYGVEKI